MKSKVQKTLRVTILFFITIVLSGCFTGYRLYTGDPRPVNEVALYKTHEWCQCLTVEEEGKPAKMFYSNPGGELLPGSYVFDCVYAYTPRAATGKDPIKVQINAQPGHLYYIYPEYPAPGIWKATVVDISRDEDFNKVPDKYRDDLRNWRNKYLEGNRPGIKQGSSGLWIPE